MKRFAILRDLDPGMTREELDAGAIQTIVNMGLGSVEPAIAWEPRISGIRWIRSYWAPGTNWAVCLYTARDAESIDIYHSMCNLPFVSYAEIEESERAGGPLPPGFGEGAPRLLCIEAPSESIGDPFTWGLLDARWIRSYTDVSDGRILAVFEADGLETRALPERSNTDWIFREIVEVTPSEYLYSE
jgi:hypothetical protein